MIQEMTERSVSAWKQNWGDGFLQYMLLAALLLLLVLTIRKNKDARMILVYACAALALFFCPFTEYVIIRAVGKSVYWRVMWILPTGIVILTDRCRFTGTSALCRPMTLSAITAARNAVAVT